MSDKEEKIKRHKTYTLRMTKFELLHLRDLFSVAFPPDGAKTVSKALADLEERSLVESVLWKKVGELCVEANLPLDTEAPDYMVAPSAPPPMGVYMLAHDPSPQAQQQQEEPPGVFNTSEEDGK